MKTSQYLFTMIILCFVYSLNAQVTKDQAIVALDQLINAEANKKFKKALEEDMASVSAMTNFSVDDYNELEDVYSRMEQIYNRIYLAEIKLDLTSFKQLKRLGRNPEKQSKKYRKHLESLLGYYERSFIPIMSELEKKNSPVMGDINEDERDSLYLEEQRLRLRQTGISNFSNSLSIVSNAFSLVNNISNMISNKRRENQSLIREFVAESNSLFASAQLQSWDSYGIPIPSEYNNESNYDSNSGNEEYTEDTRGQSLPPTDLVGLPSISGDVYFEVLDESSGEDMFMNIEEGSSSDLAVNDYGDSGASFDLKIGKKRGSEPAKKNVDVSPYITSDYFSAGTQYRVRASGNGYVYIFSINSGNKMYGIYPSMGETHEIDYGTYYNYPDNVEFSDDGSGRVAISIPAEDGYYIEISDPENGIRPEAETMIVLFSRSQLDMRDLLEQMEYIGSSVSPQERLAQIFGTIGASSSQADVSINNGILSYYLDENDPMVLPLVFSIRRN